MRDADSTYNYEEKFLLGMVAIWESIKFLGNTTLLHFFALLLEHSNRIRLILSDLVMCIA